LGTPQEPFKIERKVVSMINKEQLENVQKDLQYALEKEWFGVPTDCIPKSIIQQILGASIDNDKFEIYQEKINK